MGLVHDDGEVGPFLAMEGFVDEPVDALGVTLARPAVALLAVVFAP